MPPVFVRNFNPHSALTKSWINMFDSVESDGKSFEYRTEPRSNRIISRFSQEAIRDAASWNIDNHIKLPPTANCQRSKVEITFFMTIPIEAFQIASCEIFPHMTLITLTSMRTRSAGILLGCFHCVMQQDFSQRIENNSAFQAFTNLTKHSNRMQLELPSLFLILAFALAAHALPMTPAQEPTPTLTALFTAYSRFDFNHVYTTTSNMGSLVNAHILDGNWTLPNGELYAVAVTPSYGGEVDTIDINNVMNVDSHYVVQFQSDGVIANVHFQGTGTELVKNQGVIQIATASKANQHLVNKYLFAPGYFASKDTLKAVYYELTPYVIRPWG